MFADDLFFFGRATNRSVQAIKDILGEYENWSEQKVNHTKSSIHFSKKMNPQRKIDFADILGVTIMKNTDKYLGWFLLQSWYLCASYDFLIQKFYAKLNGWRSKYLTHARRTILIQSTLASIPIYYMGICFLPVSVIAKIKRIQCAFWWGHEDSKRRLHFLNWDYFCRPKNEGGLGIRNMEMVNKSLVAKLAWRFITEKDAIWVKLLTTKYLKSSSFWECNRPKKVNRTWDSILKVRDMLRRGACWSVGTGNCINLLSDPWIPNLPRYKPISTPNQQSITKVRELISEDGKAWDIDRLRNSFSDLEVEAITSIHIPQSYCEDRLVWTYIPTGIFTAKSVYKLLQSDMGSTSSLSNNMHWKSFWKTKGLSPRVLHFIWRLVSGALALKENIARLVREADTTCPFCKSSTETTCTFSLSVTFQEGCGYKALWNSG